MAYAPQTRTLDGTAFGSGLGGLRSAFSARLARYRAYRRTVEELTQLSDRDLADMGMHRSNIAQIAREATDRA